jgi:hypothetical protein
MWGGVVKLKPYMALIKSELGSGLLRYHLARAPTLTKILKPLDDFLFSFSARADLEILIN